MTQTNELQVGSNQEQKSSNGETNNLIFKLKAMEFFNVVACIFKVEVFVQIFLPSGKMNRFHFNLGTNERQVRCNLCLKSSLGQFQLFPNRGLAACNMYVGQ